MLSPCGNLYGYATEKHVASTSRVRSDLACFVHSPAHWLTHWLTHWLIEWLIDWLTHPNIDLPTICVCVCIHTHISNVLCFRASLIKNVLHMNYLCMFLFFLVVLLLFLLNACGNVAGFMMLLLLLMTTTLMRRWWYTDDDHDECDDTISNISAWIYYDFLQKVHIRGWYVDLGMSLAQLSSRPLS